MSHLIALTLMLTFFDVSMFVNVLTKNNYMPKQRIAHFSSGSTFANFNENEDGSITKRALILCSGEHTDSKGRKHYFDDEYIFTVAENTNLEFNSGANIPVLKEHNKHVDSIVGSLESTVEARVITEEDLPDPRQKHLLGRVGLFAQNVLIKANDAVEKVKQGLARTISAGLDLKDKKIREISLVSIPAIKGMALYSMMDKEDNSKPMTFEEMEAYEKDEEGLKEEYEEYAEMLYKVLCNIKCCEDMTVSGEQQSELIQQAFLDFSERVSDLMFGDMNEISADDDEPNNPYSMIPGGNTMSPYSMFTGDDAEFAFNFGSTLGRGFDRGIKTASNVGRQLFKGRFGSAGNITKNYFTRVKGLNTDGTRTVGKRSIRWGRVAGTGATLAGGLGAGTMAKNTLFPKQEKKRNLFNINL